MRNVILVAVFLSIVSTLPSHAPAADPYTQTMNVIYGDAYGVGLLMDVFTPPADKKNGYGIVDIASGAWHSDRGKINDHKKGKTYDILCGRGFTVFAVRPGSITKFSAPDMLKNINTGIGWVKQHAGEYGIKPEELGLTGASAGGHLASLAAVTADDKTRVKAVAVFFPPTDLLEYGKLVPNPRGKERFDLMVRRLALPDGVEGKTDEQIHDAVVAISPARLVTEKAPPFLVIHGDADPAVPLQQSQKLVDALKAKNVPVELIIKAGGRHAWPTIPEEVAKVADFFEKTLVKKPVEAAAK